MKDRDALREDLEEQANLCCVVGFLSISVPILAPIAILFAAGVLTEQRSHDFRPSLSGFLAVGFSLMAAAIWTSVLLALL